MQNVRLLKITKAKKRAWRKRHRNGPWNQSFDSRFQASKQTDKNAQPERKALNLKSCSSLTITNLLATATGLDVFIGLTTFVYL